MDFHLKESLKLGFALVGGVLLVYQAIGVVTKNAPLRSIVNPQRRGVLLGGVGVVSLGYSALAILAGNKWLPADVWAVTAPLFYQQPTLLRVVAADGLLAVGIALTGAAGFCYVAYPRDPRTFVPRERHPKAIRWAMDDTLYHYTTRRGGLEYAGVIVLPADGAVPTAEQLVETTTATVTTVGYRLIECLDRRDARENADRWGRHRADREQLRARRLDWLELAVVALAETARLAKKSRECDLGEIGQVRAKAQRGGLLFEYLLPQRVGEPDVILFGVTTSADEVTSGRLELHFAMLKEALGLVIRVKSDLCDIPAESGSRSSVQIPVPAA